MGCVAAVQVNVSELGLVTPAGKVVWGKYAQVRAVGWQASGRLPRTGQHAPESVTLQPGAVACRPTVPAQAPWGSEGARAA